MTMTAPDRRHDLAPKHWAVWCEVERGFWVGNDSGVFLGTVELRRGRYVALDSTHHRLGVFDARSTAQAAVEAHR